MKNNAVLLSIQPRWCELIANRKKTIEIRKTRPKLGEPFKCYIYCTKSNKEFLQSRHNVKFYCEDKDFIGGHYEAYQRLNSKVIGEFTCDSIYKFEAEISRRADAYEAITLRRMSEDFSEYGDYRYSLVAENGDEDNWLMYQSCVGWNELRKYLSNKNRDFYGWHISDLVIYDKPKKLGEFGLTRPPQSWCYVQEEKL